MCENQNMESKHEDLKVIHSQHVRILKEEDEIWISSEDLNTENSSDDERSKSRQAFKKKLKPKHRKRSSPNIRIQRPSVSAIPSTSGGIDERLLMPKSDDLNSKSDDSRTSDEEYIPPTIPSECLSKRLSLEDWRPTKGALNISSIEESTSTAGDARKIVNETSNFYNVMLHKLKSLKSCSVLNSARKENSIKQEKLSVEVKTFKSLKNTPEVKQQLEFINKLDEEIDETISRYKAEREDRLRTEFEMCKAISEQTLPSENGAEYFLELCNFEERLKLYKSQAANSPVAFNDDDNESIQDADTVSNKESNDINVHEGDQMSDECLSTADEFSNSVSPMNFVRRNIYAAKEGVMANFSLTDEQKTKIADILKDIDDFQLTEAELELSERDSTEGIEDNNNENTERHWNNATSDSNAFAVPDVDRFRIGQINEELEKFQQDEKQNEKSSSSKGTPLIKDDEFWKKYILDQSLKDIDNKLEKLYASYVEDEEKLRSVTETEDRTDDIVVGG